MHARRLGRILVDGDVRQLSVLERREGQPPSVIPGCVGEISPLDEPGCVGEVWPLDEPGWVGVVVAVGDGLALVLSLAFVPFVPEEPPPLDAFPPFEALPPPFAAPLG